MSYASNMVDLPPISRGLLTDQYTGIELDEDVGNF